MVLPEQGLCRLCRRVLPDEPSAGNASDTVEPPEQVAPTSTPERLVAADFQRCRQGLTMMGIGGFGAIGWMILMLTSFAFAYATSNYLALAWLADVSAAGYALFGVLILIGQAMCLTVPVPTGARLFVVCAVVFQIASFAISLGTRFGAGTTGTQLAVVTALPCVMNTICMLLMMQHLAKFFRDEQVSVAASRLLKSLILVPVLMIGGGIVIPLAGSNVVTGLVQIAIGLILIFFGIYLAIAYASLALRSAKMLPKSAV